MKTYLLKTYLLTFLLGGATAAMAGGIFAPVPVSAQSLTEVCAHNGEGTPGEPAECRDLRIAMTPANLQVPLENTRWSLTQYRDDSGSLTAAQTFVTPASIQFRDGQVGGNATCNRFFGRYTLEGETLSIQSVGSTLMACPEAWAATQEQGFFAALEQVRGAAIAADELRLLDGEGTVLLTFAPETPPSLTETLWQLTTYNNGQGAVTSLLAGTSITATFNTHGGMTGFAGCNTYMATYEATASSLKIGASVSTRMYCNQPEGVMAQESAYLQALTTATQFEIENNTLILKTDEGATVARFTTSPESRSGE